MATLLEARYLRITDSITFTTVISILVVSNTKGNEANQKQKPW